MRQAPDPRAGGVARRIWACAGLLALGFAVVLGRAVQLQVLRQDDLSAQARDQYVREIALLPRRGPILDRNGVTLAADVEADSIFVDPRELAARGRPGDATRLARALGVDPAALERRVARGGRFAWVKRRVTPAESAAARTLKLPGVGFVKEFRRYYPSRDVAGQVLGAVGEAGDGLEGVERLHDAVLRGDAFSIPAQRDGRGVHALDAPPVPSEALVGGRVELTIDQKLQSFAEQALARAVERSRAAAGMLVAIDPSTGEILALANAPLYNPNAPKRTPALLRNRAVLDTFEPGSTMKTFTLAAALEAGTLRPADGIDVGEGRLQIGRHTIRDDHRPDERWLDGATVLAVSSNVGTARAAQQVGGERLRRTLLDFGFGERPGFGLAGEPRGQVPPIRSELALATTAFGYAVTASPLQITAAMGAIANGGVLMRPLLVRRVVERRGSEKGAEDRVVFEARPAPLRRAVSEKTAATMAAWLEGVVARKDGTGKRARLERWRAAGKTGTAKKVDPVAGGYSRDKRFSSFVGFAPAASPRIAIGVFVDEPKADRYGGEVAAPVFREVAEWALASFGVPPEPAPPPPDGAEPAPEVASGPPGAAEPEPEAEDAAPEPERPLAPGSVAVPLLEGLPARSAIRRLEQAELLGEVAGTGRVAGQTPRAGQVVPRGSTVRVSLAPPG